jgi:hypothetical protein
MLGRSVYLYKDTHINAVQNVVEQTNFSGAIFEQNKKTRQAKMMQNHKLNDLISKFFFFLQSLLFFYLEDGVGLDTVEFPAKKGKILYCQQQKN